MSALGGIRVVDLSTGVAGPLAAMLLADFGADVVKVEPPGGDPGRARPGAAMWDRGKRSVVIDPAVADAADRLSALLDAADVCVTSTETPLTGLLAGSHPGLVRLHLPAVAGDDRWVGGRESPELLWALTGMSLRQNSLTGSPVDPVFPYMLYAQAVWAATTAVAALIERLDSGLGQQVTVGGLHGAMITGTMSLLMDVDEPELPAANGPGGPNPMYTRYRCADGKWIFLATLTPKFQSQALVTLGLADLLEDPRIGGDLGALNRPPNRDWVRQRFADALASRSSADWMSTLRADGVPVGPLGMQADWLDSDPVAALGLRVEVDDPVRGRVAFPGNPVTLSATPAVTDRPAPAVGATDVHQLDWAPRRDAFAGAASGDSGAPVLAGVRVLDLGAVLAGPYAGTLLAELGADVIKVEVPAGDSWRDRGMVFIRGQRGTAIDLRSPAGRDAFLHLVRTADLVIDNYRSGVLHRLGIDHEQLRKVKPDVISLSITGFGDEGPYAAEPAFDPLLQARSGMMTAQGGDGDPVVMSVAINDVTTAALAAFGSAVALWHRRRTGEGQHVSLTLVGAATLAQCEELVQVPGRSAPRRGGPDFPGPGPLDRAHRCRDGWVRVQAEASLATIAALNAERLLGAGADLGEQLAAALAGLTRQEAVDRLAKAGIPAAGVSMLRELPADPDYIRSEAFTSLDRPGESALLAPGRYALFSRSVRDGALRPCGVGEHTVEVLAEAGLSSAAIDELTATGAVRQGGPMALQVFAAYR